MALGELQAVCCDTCGRPAVEDERIGFTCGARLLKPFKVLTEREQAESLTAALTGQPLPASHPASMVAERCMGSLR